MNVQNKKVSQGLKLLVKSSIIVFIGVILSKIFTYLYRIVIARYYGPESYGLLSLALMIFGWFVSVSSLGLAEGILRYVSLFSGDKNQTRAKIVIKYSLKITFFSGLFASILLFLLAEPISSFFRDVNLVFFIKGFSLVLLFSLFSKIFLSILRAYQRITIYSFILNILQNGIVLLFFLLFLWNRLDSNKTIVFSYALGFVVSSIASFLFCKYTLPKIFLIYKKNKNLEVALSKELISYSWPLMFIGIIVTLFYWTDTLFIGHFLSIREVGLYNAALSIISILSIFPDLFSQLFLPMITNEFSKKNFKLINFLSKQVNKWTLILNLPIFLIIFIFPGAVINIFFGETYLIAENALRILCISAIFGNFTPVFTNLMTMLGKSKVLLYNSIFVVSFNILLNWILVPKLGINGAAIATMSSWIIWSAFLFFEVFYFLKFIPIKKEFFKILLVSLFSILLLIYSKSFFSITLINLLILVLSFSLVYIFLIFITRCLDSNDLMILKAIKRRIIK